MKSHREQNLPLGAPIVEWTRGRDDDVLYARVVYVPTNDSVHRWSTLGSSISDSHRTAARVAVGPIGYNFNVKPREVIWSTIRAAVSMLLKLDRRIRNATSSPTTAPMVPHAASGSHRRLPVLDDLESVVELVKQRPDLFLLYSEGPAADIGAVSRDYEADVSACRVFPSPPSLPNPGGPDPPRTG